MEYTCITDALDAAAKQLNPHNPLLTGDGFDLRNSMTALEIGDDRMDVDFSNPLLLSKCVSLPPSSSNVDENFQTILTTTAPIHVHNPPIPSYAILNAFALKLNVRLVAYLKGDCSFMESVGTAGVHDEICTPAPPSPESSAIPSPGHDRDQIKCLLHLFCFNTVMTVRDIAWYGDVYEEEDIGMGYNDVDMGQWKRELSELSNVLTELFDFPLESLTPAETSHRISALSLCETWLQGHPVHACIYPSIEDSVKYWQSSVNVLQKSVGNLLSLPGMEDCFLRRLAAHYRTPLPVLNRSLLSLNLYTSDMILGQFGLHDVICQDMLDRGIARVIVVDEVVLDFIQGIGRPIFEWVKVGSWNLERRYEQLSSNKNCIKPWDDILRSALLVDQSLSERLQIESTYIYSYCLSFVVSYQLELLMSGDRGGQWFSDVRWWYGDYLHNCSSKITDRFREAANMIREMQKRQFVEIKRKEMQEEWEAKSKKKRKSKAKIQKELDEIAYVPSESEVRTQYLSEVDILCAHFNRYLCCGLFRLIAALKVSKIMPQLTYSYTSPSNIFESVIKHLMGSQPPLLTYEDYLKAAASAEPGSKNALDILDQASEAFGYCKQLIEQVSKFRKEITSEGDLFGLISEDEVKKLAKITISNNLSCLKIKGIISKFKSGDGVWSKEDTKYAVRFNSSIHEWYEVVEVVEKSKR
ncbi:hypothetical protein TL16_g07672 [Triparma laevis f. inornata]|uniref:NAA35-like TPR repeats domain-containing protein n=2 Tax=Triparma laevis TaxID=1534972 RepID=A0A9W7CEI9_9STRA|nr:hypothetical protein TL16_g07672 [Triparma laevis f. inornata]GMI03151.1 hypothetical protein TrLO_g2506 [Triparma laevis f. longispina]